MSKQKVILSGIQPTGNLHFGRYFGAVQNWVRLQESYDCVYFVADYHAMTMPFNPKKLKQNVWEVVFNLLAAGVKAENLIIQSLVPEHVELSWLLNCFTSYGMLSRMTQFKDKSAQSSQAGGESFTSSALFTYPVLQAADILIYQADLVPVGKDQEQHLELTRNIAQRFNNQIKEDFFTLPEPLFTEIPKVMSTADPTRKMSASQGEKHNIDLFADEKRIAKQIRSAVTDTGDTPEGEMSAGVANLFRLLRAAGSQEAHDSLLADYQGGTLQYVDLKEATAQALIELSHPMQTRKAELLTDKKAIQEQIRASSETIRKRAQLTLREAKGLVGLSNV